MIELKLSIQDTPKCNINNIKRLHLSYMGPILISLLRVVAKAKTTENTTTKCYGFYCSLHTLINVQCAILTCMCLTLIKHVSVDVYVICIAHDLFLNTGYLRSNWLSLKIFKELSGILS